MEQNSGCCLTIDCLPIRGNFRIGRGDLLLDEAQRAILGARPGVQLRLGQAAPPGLIGEAQRPVRMPSRYSNQAVASTFFRA
jgi:hypothetical protein